MLKVGLTGGIGSGKSTASRIFRQLGIPVYDADSAAKQLMTSDPQLIVDIKALLGEEAYVGGELNKRWIASRIFGDKDLLAKMNATVHPAVIRDFERWADEQAEAAYVVMENAILFESGFDKAVDCSVTVSAPLDQRLARAASRDGVSEEMIRERVTHQMDDAQRESRADFVVTNEDLDLLLPQILKVHEALVAMATNCSARL